MSDSKQGYEGPFKFSYPDDYVVAPGVVWLIEGVLLKGGITWMYGPPKSGKTYVAVSWIGCVQSGQMWAGLKVRQMDTVYLAMEGHNGIVRRHMAWKRVNGVLRPTRTALVRESVDLASKPSLDRLAMAFEAQGRCPGLIVIDTFQRAAPNTDITSPKDTAMVLSNVDWLRAKLDNDVSIVFVSHTRKNDDRFLGAQNIYGWIDCMIKAVPKDGSLTLSCDGIRDGEAFDDIAMQFETTTVNTDQGPQTDRAIVGRASFEERLFAQDKAMATKTTADKEAVVAVLRTRKGEPFSFTDLKASTLSSRKLSAALKELVKEGKVVQPEGEGHRPYILVPDGERITIVADGSSASFSTVGLVRPPKGGTELNQIPNLVQGVLNRTEPNTKSGSLLGDAICSTLPSIDHHIAEPSHTPELKEALADD